MRTMPGTLAFLLLTAISSTAPISAQQANPANAASSPAAPPISLDPARAAIEQVVREYILQHPEVLMESVRQYGDRLKAAQKERSKEAVSAKLSDLQQDPSSPAVGKVGAVTVVEFFDYRCGFCKKSAATISKLMVEHPEVQFVFKELPILGPDSLVAAKAGLAAHKQGGYLKFHQALMALTGPITMDAIGQLAAKQGLDVAKLRTDMESPEVQLVLERNKTLATEVGVNATPTFFVNSEVVPGAIDTAAFEVLIARAKLPGAQSVGASSHKQ